MVTVFSDPSGTVTTGQPGAPPPPPQAGGEAPEGSTTETTPEGETTGEGTSTPDTEAGQTKEGEAATTPAEGEAAAPPTVPDSHMDIPGGLPGGRYYDTDGDGDPNYVVIEVGGVEQVYATREDGTTGQRVYNENLDSEEELNKMAADAAAENAAEEGGAGVDVASTGGEGEAGGPATEADRSNIYEDVDWSVSLALEAAKYGSWYNFLLRQGESQRFVRSISRWAGYDEDNLGEDQAKAVYWIQTVFGGYNTWADLACRNNLETEEGSTYISSTGFTSFDIEGERMVIEPCPGLSTGSLTLPNGSIIDCSTYYRYRVTGEAVPAEAAMEFDVYLNLKATDTDFQAGQDLHLYKNANTGEYMKIKLNRTGTRWSLTGPSMFVYENKTDYDYVCMKFTGETFANMMLAMGVLSAVDNPYCNKIVEANPETAQRATTETAGTGGVPTTTTPG